MNEPVSDERMKELVNAARPGPWDPEMVQVPRGGMGSKEKVAEIIQLNRCDMHFIAAARTWIPAALERIATMELTLSVISKGNEPGDDDDPLVEGRIDTGPECGACKKPTVPIEAVKRVTPAVGGPSYDIQAFVCPRCFLQYYDSKLALEARREREVE